MRRRVALVLAAVASAVVCAAPAEAHAPIAGVGAFWNGALHPFVVPLHLLTIVAVGMAVGQHAPQQSRVGWPVFVAAFAVAIALARTDPPDVSLPLTALACFAGLLVALGGSAAVLLAVLAVTAAVVLGLDSAPAGAAAGEDGLARLGTFAGGVLAVTLVGGVVAALRRSWQRIAVRAVGSWIAAATMLVLALDLAGGGRA